MSSDAGEKIWREWLAIRSTPMSKTVERGRKGKSLASGRRQQVGLGACRRISLRHRRRQKPQGVRLWRKNFPRIVVGLILSSTRVILYSNEYFLPSNRKRLFFPSLHQRFPSRHAQGRRSHLKSERQNLIQP
ncbi:unnamed protein product [Chondrus crispus]|uniref:Uncharacterized protein n=1 Tax=Chondrus crispus TaxID=2769 RepID=R7QNW6_CHOCR|nr:unnamed protein product [Chondrus crispus]CDF39176.1 unnamed protein product [Chondrus crispus]|eukprot:XP_005719087.1 unnamed protein product [Chondrus crispus]